MTPMFFIINTKHRRRECAEFIMHLKASPVMCVEIKPYKNIRSQNQNRLYWMYLNVLSDYTGDTADELHEQFKTRILGVVTKERMGPDGMITLVEPRSTSNLTTTEFTTYLRAIEALAMNLGVTIPRPDGYDSTMGYEEKETTHEH